MKMHGGWMWPDSDDYMWREMRQDGTYQRSHFDKAMEFVTDRRCALDGGAHVGLWSSLMAKEFERVIAVEPAPDTHACLVTNMHRQNLQHKVTCRHVALGASLSSVSLALDAKQAARGNTGGRYVVPGGVIPVDRVDDLCLPSLGLLKLDVEGSEPAAIEGAVETLKRCKPVVLFEDKKFCTRMGYASDASQKLLAGVGYEHKARVGHDEIWCAA